MRLLSLTRIHARIARRQLALWLAALPLTAFATLLSIISPARPDTGGIADLAFAAQIIVMFTGIAYAAAFPDFIASPVRAGMHELEATTQLPDTFIRTARALGTFAVTVTPSFAILLAMGLFQATLGQPWSALGALAVTVTVVAPGTFLAVTLSGTVGALMPQVVARIVAVLIWFVLVFSSPLLPLPTPNGSVFSVIGDAVVAGYFGANPIYHPSGPLSFDGSPASATLSVVAQVCVVTGLLLAGSRLAQRTHARAR